MSEEETIKNLGRLKTMLVANNSFDEQQIAIDNIIYLYNTEKERAENYKRDRSWYIDILKDIVPKAEIRSKIIELKIEKDDEYIKNGDSKDYYIYYGGILELEKILGDKDD